MRSTGLFRAVVEQLGRRCSFGCNLNELAGEIGIAGCGTPPRVSAEEHRVETPRPRTGEAGDETFSRILERIL